MFVGSREAWKHGLHTGGLAIPAKSGIIGRTMTRTRPFEIPVGYPDLRDDPLRGRRNLGNLALALWVPIPAFVFTIALFRWFEGAPIPADPGLEWPGSLDEAAALLLHHPLLTANLLFFVFVDLQFWLIALVQRSSWLIDPYWTLLPPLLAWLYLAHPMATPDPARAALAVGALLVWSIGLTWSYFRREQWRFGYREDWRYAQMRLQRRHFWLEQLFVVHLAQHLMLVGVSLPFWAIAFRHVDFGALDLVFFLLAGLGIAIGRVADRQLDAFMRENEARRGRGEEKIPILDQGLWRTSRHPNYFGEQLFWWSIAGFGAVCGEPWVAIGAAFNSIVLAGVTIMTERRMLAVPERRAAFEAYRRRTSALIPWWPRPRPHAQADPSPSGRSDPTGRPDRE
jgi:steroid 5-alpha reductase family enzyme